MAFVPDEGEKEALLAADPVIYSTTPHYDGYPVVLVDLDAIDLDELAEVITESWRVKAPKKVLAAHPDIAPGPS